MEVCRQNAQESSRLFVLHHCHQEALARNKCTSAKISSE